MRFPPSTDRRLRRRLCCTEPRFVAVRGRLWRGRLAQGCERSPLRDRHDDAAADRSGSSWPRRPSSHGVPGFPDPNSSGTFDGNEIKQLRAGQTRVREADRACIHLLPNGVVPIAPRYTITHADQLDYLNGAACMRRHGIPDFPDPTFQSNGVTFSIPSSIDKNSPRVRSALGICQKLIPAGLPYSGTN